MNEKTLYPFSVRGYALKPVHLFTKEIYGSDLPFDTFDG